MKLTRHKGLKEANEDKLHDVTSKYTKLQSLHNEVIEKQDQNKEDLIKY